MIKNRGLSQIVPPSPLAGEGWGEDAAVRPEPVEG